MNLYLVRHGRTYWNEAGRLQGWSESELTLEGLEQASRTATFFAEMQARRQITFHTLYSSPLNHTWYTAGALGQALSLVPVAVPDLREMAGGAAEGMTRDEWRAHWPALWELAQDRHNPDFGWPGGETRRSFRDRSLRAVDTILARHGPHDNVIAVTHGGFIKAYLQATGLDDPLGPRSYDADNCSITYVHFPPLDAHDGGNDPWIGCLRGFNETRHLQDDTALQVANVDVEL